VQELSVNTYQDEMRVLTAVHEARPPRRGDLIMRTLVRQSGACQDMAIVGYLRGGTAHGMDSNFEKRLAAIRTAW